jgi:argininosuccinate lyase
MLERDAARLSDARKRVDVSVMGSGAIAGSALSLDREFTARKSGFSGISANSIDSVSDRDFMVEIVSAISMLGVHLSRISEDFILYSTGEFGFIDIGEEYCTGSSLMPQKKNADVLELARGRSSFFIGALASLLTLLKGLPHAYNRDLQEDKRHLFESVSAIKDELLVLSRLVGTIIVEESGVAAQMEDEFLLSTDIAEYLVQKGIPFREAHAVVGAMVRYCIDKGKGFTGMDVRELKGFSDAIGDDFSGILSPEYSVKNKKTPGGTNPEHVGREIKRWKRKLEM